MSEQQILDKHQRAVQAELQKLAEREAERERRAKQGK